MEKIKDTRLGAWLKEKAPYALPVVGNFLPDKGVLGIIKNLVTATAKDMEFERLMKDMEQQAQENVTKRWEADMKSDAKLAKIVHPLTLMSLLLLYLVLAVTDSISAIDFDVKDTYIDLLEILSITAFGAYFAGRSLEKSKKV